LDWFDYFDLVTLPAAGAGMAEDQESSSTRGAVIIMLASPPLLVRF